LQGARPRCGRILTKPLGVEKEPAPFREELFLIDDYIWTLRTFLEEELQEILSTDEEGFFFHPIRSCETCPFHDHCLERAGATQDLSLLPDIRKIQKRHLNRAGVLDIPSLAAADEDTLKEASRASGVTLAGLEKLKLQAESTVTGEPVPRGLFASPREACLALTESELDLPGEKEGVRALDFTDPALVHVHFDMESDPYSDFEYLFGMLVDVPDDPLLERIVDPEAPVVFVHVEHEGCTQESPEEAEVVARIVVELIGRSGVDPKGGLCVVAAHRRQNNLIRQAVAAMVEERKLKGPRARRLLSADLVIDTVERIQGQERDAVIVSLTASDEEHIRSEKDFLMMPNRMNVSFTRPKSKLIVVGSKKLFRTVPVDREELHEEEIDGRKVVRSKGVMLANHFKRWYFHVKEDQRVV
jgi:hypothetical protein